MELDHKFRSPKRRRIFCKLQPHKTCNKVSNVVMHQCMYCIVGMFAGSKRMGALYRVYSFVFVMLITKYGSLLYIFLLFNSASYLCPVFEKVCSCFFFVHSVVFSFHFNEIDDYRNCVIYLINCNILLTPECRLLRERRKVLCCLLAIQNCDSFLRHKQNLCRLFFHFFRAFHLQHFKPFEQSQALYSCSSDFFCLHLSPFLTLSFSLLFIRVLFYCSLFIQRHARCIYFLHIY